MAENISVYWGRASSFAELTSQEKKKKNKAAAVKHFHILSIRIQGFRKDVKVSGS